MTDIVKVTEEEFDEEGNLTRRIVTEYGETEVNRLSPYYRYGYLPNTTIWPYKSGEFTVTNGVA